MNIISRETGCSFYKRVMHITYEECQCNDISQIEKVEIQLLLDGIYRLYGYDFRDYVFSSISRRISHRMRAEGLHTISGLQEKVFHDPACMERLLSDFSIQVTEMFRDPACFLAFREKVVPNLRELPMIRIWHAGCSSGEEVYSMAILLHEEGLLSKTRLYATDMNEQALAKARSGIFPLGKMKTYTRNYLQAGGKESFSKYYTVSEDRVIFDPMLKKHMVYAQHNLVTDSSLNEFHVIVCRNVMIYFNKDLQQRVHQLFYDSLSSLGFLMLGKKETIEFTVYADKYWEVDEAERIYRKRL